MTHCVAVASGALSLFTKNSRKNGVCPSNIGPLSPTSVTKFTSTVQLSPGLRGLPSAHVPPKGPNIVAKSEGSPSVGPCATFMPLIVASPVPKLDTVNVETPFSPSTTETTSPMALMQSVPAQLEIATCLASGAFSAGLVKKSTSFGSRPVCWFARRSPTAAPLSLPGTIKAFAAGCGDHKPPLCSNFFCPVVSCIPLPQPMPFTPAAVQTSKNTLRFRAENTAIGQRLSGGLSRQ